MKTMPVLRAAKILATLCLSLLAMSWSVSSYAHDPLRGADHDDHHAEQRNAASEVMDLTAVRNLVTVFRQTGDDRSLDEAWAILTPTLESQTNDPQTLIVAAFVAQSRHDFTYATQLIETALAINPNNDEAWLLLASVYLVRGEADLAAAACRQLRDVPLLVVLTCQARVSLAKSQFQLPLARLEAVLQVTDKEHAAAELLAWSYSVAGDLAIGSGNLQKAMSFYRQSLSLVERTQVRAALIDVLLVGRHDQEAWHVLDGGAPALPLLIRRLIVAKRLDRLHEFGVELSKVENEFRLWIAAEDWLHAREMTRFYLDVVEDHELARRLALINMDLQREPEDLRLEVRTRRAVGMQQSDS